MPLLTRGRKLLLFVTLTLMIALPLWLGGKPAIERLASVRLDSLWLLAAIIPLRWFCLAERYYVTLGHCGHRLTRRRLATIILAGDFLGENTPAASGAVAANLYFLKQAGVAVTTSLAAGTQILMLDGIAIIGILGGCLIWLTGVPALAVLLGGSLLILLFSMGCWLLLKQPYRLITLSRHHLCQRLLPRRRLVPLRANARRLCQQLRHVDRLPPWQFAYISLLSFVNWGLRLSLLFIALWAIRLSPGAASVNWASVSWATTALVQASGALAGFFTFLPGGFPSADVSIAALLQLTQPVAIIAPALIFWRLSTYYLSVLAGGGCLIWLTTHKTAASSAYNPTKDLQH